MITQDLIDEFKSYEKLDDYTSDDENIKKMLERSYEAIKHQCGEFTFDNELGKDLVFSRTRYAYQDLLEYFNDNYREDIIMLGISLMEVVNDGTETTV